MIDVIAFDGDDTLWHNESVFSLTHEWFREVVARYGDSEMLDNVLYATEKANLRLFGYGVKAFTLSMIETAIEVSSGAVSGTEIQRIIDAGKDMLAHPVELLEGVEATLDVLAGSYRLMVITKGDLFDQESKLARSGLAERFWRVAIVAEKDPDTYRRVLAAHDIDPSRFLMVGNSVPSDIRPVLEVGGRAAHVPYEITWVHESAEAIEGHDRAWNIRHLSELPALLDRIDRPDRTDRVPPTAADPPGRPAVERPSAAGGA
jgi:putative hydrolase of the HAD superfamily